MSTQSDVTKKALEKVHDNSLSKSIHSQPIGKLFWKYTIPAVMGMVVNGLYTTIDGIFIGQVVGANGLAAINMAWPIIGVLFGIGMMVGTGASSLYSISRGSGDHGGARQILGNTFILLPLLSLSVGVLLYLFHAQSMSLQGATDSVQHMGNEYLRIMSWGALPTIAGAALPMLIRNDDSPQLATILMALGAVLNIILDWLFVVHLDQKVAGAAFATIIAQTVVMVIGVGYFFSGRAQYPLNLQSLKLRWTASLKTLQTGFPGLIMFLYFSFVFIIHNRLFLEHGGVVAVAAFAIVGYVQAFYYMFSEGIAHGVQPLVSYNKGAGNNRNIRQALGLGMKTALGLGIISLLVVNLFADSIAGVFINSDPQLMASTINGFRLHLFTMFLDGMIVIAAAYFQALALARLATLISLGNMLVQLPLLFLLPDWLGTDGVWLSMPLSNIFLAAIVGVLLMRDLRNRPDTTPWEETDALKKVPVPINKTVV